jgi:hypothetical protein
MLGIWLLFRHSFLTIKLKQLSCAFPDLLLVELNERVIRRIVDVLLDYYFLIGLERRVAYDGFSYVVGNIRSGSN